MQTNETVRTLREEKGLNQKQLAELAGISQATISRIENGDIRELKSESVKKLADALGVSVDYLLSEEPDLLALDSSGNIALFVSKPADVSNNVLELWRTMIASCSDR